MEFGRTIAGLRKAVLCGFGSFRREKDWLASTKTPNLYQELLKLVKESSTI